MAEKARLQVSTNITKIDLFITEITIILHDSLVSTILLVLAITSLYDEVKPMLDNFTSVNALIVSLNASLIKSPIPHLFFAVIFLIWIWGFLVKRLKEDNDIKEEKLWKKEVSETLSNIEKLLRGGKQYDN